MRTITQDDIEFLVSDIPLQPTPYKDIAKFNRDKIIKYIRDNYLGKKISDKVKTITKKTYIKGSLIEEKVEMKAIDSLKEVITETYFRSLSIPGEPIGIKAAMAITEPVMQLNFNTFHSVGAVSEVSNGLKDIQELLNISSKIKKSKGKTKPTTDYTTIHFKDKFLSKEEMMKETYLLVQRTVADLTENHEYLDDILPEDKEWYKLHEEIFNRKKPDFPLLRLYLNLDRMFSSSITMGNIKDILEVEGNKLTVFYSPLSLGIVDIYPDGSDLREMIEGYEKTGKGISQCQGSRSTKYKEKTELEDKEDIRFLFLQIVNDCLSQIVVMGNRGVQGISVKSTSLIFLMTFVKDEDNHYKVIFDSDKIKLGNYPFDNFVKFLEAVSEIDKEVLKVVKVSGENDEVLHAVIKYDKNKIKNANKPDKPETYISDLIKVDKLKLNNEAGENLKNKIYKLPNYTNLMRTAYYNYAIAAGSKISGALMKHPSLDRTRIIPNNVIDIARLFGIESARTYLVQSYMKIISPSKSSNNICENVGLLADFQTLSGYLTSVNANGAAKRQSSALTNSAFQDPYGAFQKAAAFGKCENVLGVSECIMSGKKLNIGSGYVYVKVFPPNIKENSEVKETNVLEDIIEENVAGDEYLKTKEDNTPFNKTLRPLSEGYHFEIIYRKPSSKILELFSQKKKEESDEDDDFTLPEFKTLDLNE